MKTEEAVKVLSQMINIQYETNRRIGKSLSVGIIPALEVAIEALDRQVPTKPVSSIHKVAHEFYDEIRYEKIEIFFCPLCGERLDGFRKSNNCPHCGQRLDWED